VARGLTSTTLGGLGGVGQSHRAGALRSSTAAADLAGLLLDTLTEMVSHNVQDNERLEDEIVVYPAVLWVRRHTVGPWCNGVSVYDKVRQSVTSKSKSKKHRPITGSDQTDKDLVLCHTFPPWMT